MSAPGASPGLQDLSECPINFLRGDVTVDSQLRAFLEARDVCARTFSALKVHALAGRLSETLWNSQLPLWSVIRDVDGIYVY